MSDLVTILITGILAAFGGAGFWGWMTSRRKAPIDDATAINAMAGESQEMALEYAKQVRADMEAMRRENEERVKNYDARISKLTEEFDKARNESRELVAQVIGTWTRWYESLWEDWPVHCQREYPPDAPLTPGVHHPLD